MHSWEMVSVRGILMFGLIAVAGCSGGGASVAPVKGTVTYMKELLKEGEITFIPAKGQAAHGKIVDGQITDVKTGDANGVTIGKCEVTISSIEGGKDMYAKVKSRIPEKYSDPAKGKLTTEIKSGENIVTFDLVK